MHSSQIPKQGSGFRVNVFRVSRRDRIVLITGPRSSRRSSIMLISHCQLARYTSKTMYTQNDRARLPQSTLYAESKMEIQQGAVLSLKCRVEGETDPIIRWFKDGLPIDSTQNNRVEIIKSLCPSTHTGPQCTEPILPSLQTPPVPLPPDSTTIEEDFVLDQSGMSSHDPYRTLLDPDVNKCVLPEYRYTSECSQVNSHFYAFVGTAIACSVIILLLGSCLGYIRRRKILNVQARNGKAHRGKGSDLQSDSTPLHEGPESQQQLRVCSPTAREDSPIFVSAHQTTPATPSVSVRSAVSGQDDSFMHSTLSRAVTGVPEYALPRLATGTSIDGIQNPFAQPAYVVLTTTTPVALHPLAENTNRVAPNRTPITSTLNPTHVSQWFSSPTQSALPTSTVNTPFPSDIIPVGFLGSPKGTLRCGQGFPTSPPCSAHTEKIYVQIPPITAPFYLTNELQPTGPDTRSVHKGLNSVDATRSDSGVTDIGSEMIAPLSPTGMAEQQLLAHSIKVSPTLKGLLQSGDIGSNRTDLSSSPNAIPLKQINPDCVPLVASSFPKTISPVNTSLPNQSDPTSLVTFKCAGSGAHT
ncbi:unnamed protein product [Echinostoma caproni]|uniref:Ig-like domain-containing protein n=1 Tax=Echinostoma caproni TaxID=27848 RepID=A0A183A676_9TREM|nr:unnamed protein product [Echinostoma caproni]